MNAYLGSDRLKMSYIRTALEHEEADSYVKGIYWAEAEKRGCNIGCWTKAESGRHGALAAEMGVPEQLLHLSDGLFEALPDPHFKSWSRRFAGAIPVGADLGHVGGEFLHWLLCDDQWGLKLLSSDGAMRSLFRDMGRELWAAWTRGDAPSSDMQRRVDGARQGLSAWRSWDEHALRDMRALRASLELWKARPRDTKSLARAAWSCRAAWSAWESYSVAQSEALIDMLGQSQAPAPFLACA